MRKVILTILIVVAIALGVAPYTMGLLAKHSIEKAIAALSYPPYYQVRINEYRVGWLNSRVELGFYAVDFGNRQQLHQAIKNPAATVVGEPLFTVNGRVQHGPFLVTLDDSENVRWDFGRGMFFTDLQFKPQQEQQFLLDINQIPKIHGETLISLLGDYDWQLVIDPIEFFHKQENLLFKWGGLRYHMLMAANFNHANIRLNIFPVDTSDNKNNSLNFSGLETNSEIDRNNPYHIWIGNNTVGLDQFKLVGQDWPTFSIDKLQIQSKQNLSGVLAGGNVVTTIQNIMVANKKFGPTTFRFSLNNIDAEAMGKVIEFADNLRKQGLSPDQQQQKMLEILPTIVKIFTHGVELVMNFDTTAMDGAINFNVNAKFAQTDKIGIEAMQEVVAKAQATVELIVPKALAMKIWVREQLSVLRHRAKHDPALSNHTPEQLLALVLQNADQQFQQGIDNHYFVVVGDNLKFSASYQNQNLKVNDIAFPLQQLFNWH